MTGKILFARNGEIRRNLNVDLQWYKDNRKIEILIIVISKQTDKHSLHENNNLVYNAIQIGFN